ncbi:unnamed protein product [Rhizophagus irregularis]|nr:unnamed protein product [Rhizophagus irregularis]
MQTKITLSNDIKSLLNNNLFSDIKVKGNDGKELSAHRNILIVRSVVFKRILLNGVKESTQDVIEFPEFSSDILHHVILEYLYTKKVTEQTLTIEIVAEAFHGADCFLLEQLKLRITEFFENYLRNNTDNEWNLSAKVLSRLLECMESTNNKFADLLCDSINSVPLKSIEYSNLNVKALEYILSNITREEETKMFFLSEYDLFHYIILWTASGISKEALSFYRSCLPSLETVKSLNKISSSLIDMHAKYQSTMMPKTYPLLNHVKLERIHPSIISNIIEPLNDKSVISQSSSHHEWIRMKIPISGQGLLFEWGIMVEKICEYFWAYGWVFGSNGVICHNTHSYRIKYGQTFKEKDRITVHLDMEKRTCSFSVNGKRYPIAFRNLPDEVYPAVSLRAPGRARIKEVKL